MYHLLAGLLNHRDPASLIQVVTAAFIGSLIVSALAAGRPIVRHVWVRAGAVAAVITTTSWIAFVLALRGSFPKLAVSVPLDWMVPALGLSFATTGVAALIQLAGARTARNAMLAGSILASGFSCMLFTGMAGIVRPYALAYNLSAVLITMLIGAALWSYALWEGNGLGRRRQIVSVGLVCLAITVLAAGSLAAILPIEEWLNAVARAEDLSSAPILIILAAEAPVVLALSLFGSLVDNRVAARDRVEAERLRQLADSTFEGIVIHHNGEILDANQRLANLLGVAVATLRGHRLARFIDETALSRSGDVLIGTPIEVVVIAVDGTVLPVEILSRPISFGHQRATVTALRDVRERKASEERIRFMAHHDMLTELPNRVSLRDHLEAALRVAARTGSQVSILCLDLDGFKLVNDTLGHAAGDQLLCQVANRLRMACESAFIARIGGDEFVVVHRVEDPASTVRLAKCIIDCLTDTFELDSQIVSVGTSIGIAQYPENGGDASSLLKHADIALYKAKDDGRGWYCQFQSGMDEAINEQRVLEQDLRNALENSEFELYYQPLFDQERRVIAFEALVRWHHPVRGMVPPADFIPLAEKSGLIVGVGQWVLETACAAAVTWPDHCRIAVNLSPAQFLRGNLLSVVESALRNSGLAPERLELEITEGVLLDNTDKSMQTLHALRGLGVHLVLDDFGTGYSSLSYLHRFPLDKLKVDRSFVQRMVQEPSARTIVKAILSMSRELDLRVTAEGVETEEQFSILSAQGCRELQGYLLGRPMVLGAASQLANAVGQDVVLPTFQQRQTREIERRLSTS